MLSLTVTQLGLFMTNLNHWLAIEMLIILGFYS